MLIKLISPLEIKLKKKKGYDKICLCDPCIRAAWLQEPIPLDPVELAKAPHQADLAGRLAESVAGYFLSSIPGADLFHFPERSEVEPEVDYVLTIGDRRIPVEIKYQSQINETDTRNLRLFLERTVNNATFGILVTKTDDIHLRDPRIITMPLSTLLMLK